LEVVVLAVVALFPLIDDIVGVGTVTLFIERKFAENRLERALRLDRLGDFLRIVRFRRIGSLGYNLGGCIGIQRIGFRLETCRAERRNDILRCRILAGVRTEGVVGAGNRIAGDRGQFVGNDAVTREQWSLQALIGR